MQKYQVFSAVHKVRTLLQDWPTLRLFFSRNLIEHWKLLVPGFSQGLPQQDKLKFSILDLSTSLGKWYLLQYYHEESACKLYGKASKPRECILDNSQLRFISWSIFDRKIYQSKMFELV